MKKRFSSAVARREEGDEEGEDIVDARWRPTGDSEKEYKPRTRTGTNTGTPAKKEFSVAKRILATRDYLSRRGLLYLFIYTRD